MIDKNKSGSGCKVEKKNSKRQRLTKLENAVQEVQNAVSKLQAEILKTKTQLAAMRCELDSFNRQIDRHEAGFEHLAVSSAESSEKLRESLRGKIPE
ncbi:hypothetical protein F1880_008736 [Penicillium rolfsii]|nr:hypothetical protein F1880_008736 [Penicillium rolfsii]